MPATTLDAITTTTAGVPASFAVSAGSNRMAVIVACYTHGSDAAPPTSATLGGQSATTTITVDNPGNTHDACMAVFIWNEAAIAAMSGSTVSITGGTFNNRCALHWSVQNTSQSVPAYNSEAITGTTGSLSLTRAADSMTYAVSLQDQNGGGNEFSGLANPSETAEFGTTDTNIAYGSAADTARTASFTWTNTQSRDNASIVMNFAPAPPGGLSITSVTPTDVYSKQVDVVVAGTKLSNTAVVTFAGAACTGLSASGSTSLKITMPDFYTNNIKVGTVKELKIIG